MSQSMNRAASNVGRFSSHSPSVPGFGAKVRAQRAAKSNQASTSRRQADRYTFLADALEAVDGHPLITEFGFAPDSLVLKVDSERPVAMGADTLAVAYEGAKAARELGMDPKNVGIARLFKEAGELQAQVEEKIEADRRAEKALKTKAVIPTLGTPARNMPNLLTCTCGCGVKMMDHVAVVPHPEFMTNVLGRMVKIDDLKRFIRAPGHHSRNLNPHLLTEVVAMIEVEKVQIKRDSEKMDDSRLASYVTPLPDGITATEVEHMLNQSTIDWDQVHTTLKNPWLTERELIDAKILKGQPTSKEVFCLRRYVMLLRGCKRHLQNMADRKAKQDEWNERNGLTATAPILTKPTPAQSRRALLEDPVIGRLLRKMR